MTEIAWPQRHAVVTVASRTSLVGTFGASNGAAIGGEFVQPARVVDQESVLPWQMLPLVHWKRTLQVALGASGDQATVPNLMTRGYDQVG